MSLTGQFISDIHENRKWTFEGHNETIKNNRNFILTNKICKINDGTGSDHRLIKARVVLD